MPRGKPIDIEKRSKIITLHEEKYSVRQISQKVGIPKSTIEDTIHHFQQKIAAEFNRGHGKAISVSSKTSVARSGLTWTCCFTKTSFTKKK